MDGKTYGQFNEIAVKVDRRCLQITVQSIGFEHAEDRNDKLTPGYLDDFVILSDDIEALPKDEINTFFPGSTVCGGRVTFEA
ncbi:hypothetical protein GR220_26230 [Rhizobium leguminosarum]|uniref:hypothetical protein n=1 Tax=Rhizobium ruizarguesonis TaxID=2081791 RepID=UPI000DD90D2F|nr:hypothetical protein [Rhizobium ruizarguesonis]NEI15467.1 hypothetical protein [Rhizobium ruizarguesonis]